MELFFLWRKYVHSILCNKCKFKYIIPQIKFDEVVLRVFRSIEFEQSSQNYRDCFVSAIFHTPKTVCEEKSSWTYVISLHNCNVNDTRIRFM